MNGVSVEDQEGQISQELKSLLPARGYTPWRIGLRPPRSHLSPAPGQRLAQQCSIALCSMDSSCPGRGPYPVTLGVHKNYCIICIQEQKRETPVPQSQINGLATAVSHKFGV